MPVTSFTKNVESRTMTITAQFAAPVERVWALYADARQLEQVWGPPDFPATFVDHALTVGTRSTYYMTGPDGQKYGGWWRITAVDEPHSITFDDGFADADLNDAANSPVSHNVYTFEPDGEGTRVTYVSAYDSAEDLQKILDMGVEEGTTSSINQIDDFLAA